MPSFKAVYFFFVNCNAVLISLKEVDFPYIKTPPLYTLAPNTANKMIVATNSPIDNPTTQKGIFNIPTRKNIIIGVKNGINDVAVIKPTSGWPRPNIAIIKPATTSKVIGVIICWTSSIRLTSDPRKAAKVAYKK